MKLVVMLNGVTIATYDNCATATDMMNKVNADSMCPLDAAGTTSQLAVMPVAVSGANLASGTETTPSTSDLTTALLLLILKTLTYLS